MADIRFATQAKSDQLNAVDIQGADIVIRIRDVQVRQSDQPVSIYFEGDNNKPWKPSKGMLRVLEKAWGYESDKWIGLAAQLKFDPEVKWAGKKVGGIRIAALAGIAKSGLETIVVHNKQQRELVKIAFLDMARPEYPADRFEKVFQAMADMMNHEDETKRMTLTQVIAKCQQTGDLTKQQLERLEKAAPIDNDEEM